jgi:ATP synthase assembly factor FMC1
MGGGNEAEALREAQHADQYIQYIRAQRMYVTLLERYNPGMGMDEEERVRLSARRVGMNMPVEFGGKKGGEE